MSYLNIVVILSTIIVIIYRWIKRRYQYLQDLGFSCVKPSFPLGNLKGAGSEYHANEIFVKLYEELKGKGPACGVYFFLTPNVMITDLDLARDILIKDFDCFHNRGVYFNKRDDPLSANLFSLEDNDWRHMRTKMTPTFTSGKMKVMFNAVLDVSNHMIDSIKSNTELDMHEARDILIKFMIDVIGNVAFGLEMNALKDKNSQFHVMARKVFAPSKLFFLKAFFLTGYRKLGNKLGCKFFPSEVSEFFTSVVRETVDFRLKNKIERNDFLNLLMKMYTNENGESENLTFEELAAQCFLFFVAGFETSSSASSFVLYNLAVHQDTQETLRDEIKAIIAKHDNQITYEGVNEMKYLQMVIDETLRMYGPVAQIVRVPSKDYKIANTDLVIPKGTFTGIPMNAIHMDSNYYPEPEKFDPERFNDENKANRHPMAFLPFGDGPRNCIGSRFGYMQIKIAIIQMVWNFKILSTSKTLIPMKYDPATPTASPLGGMWLKFEKL